ncbi:helix-turn-helix domain-containing protein [Blastococcus sp. CCUG 61487]|uniref:sigma-54-dependent Fis family transcriptional regulator n=1 Tax=Blastococcus sp. CCUG 61487 TaxID=1840703 RepID=UPI0010BF6D41|nr:helix-turn-helix domain-containing protein [Blastococcus sp. CCUG 61487]TKJ19544.1 Fis family transcriptional regulator [Blastococcus sp. CCUG 61487]
MTRPDRTRSRPTLSPAELERTRRTREALVEGGLLTAPPGASGVPRHIEMSWRRCVGDRVPVAPERIDYRVPQDVLPALCRAAAPVLNRIRDSLSDVPVALVLSDAHGRIVMRHAPRQQGVVMDRASAAEGFDYSERSVGTNGIGTALVERRTVLVRGPEHYNPLLEQLTCASTPVIDPGSGRVVGSFSLACSMREVHALMAVMAGDIGRQIEARLLDEAGERRQRFVQAYLELERTGTGALVVDEDAVLVNRLGLAHTGPELHPLLWRFLSEHGPDRARRMQVPLPDGVHEALVEPVSAGGTVAYTVRLLPNRPGRPPDEPPVTPWGIGTAVRVPPPEPLHFDADVDRQLLTAARHGETVAVTGTSGTGKLWTALRTVRRAGGADPLVVEPRPDADWFEAARTAVAGNRGLVLRRLHEGPAPTPRQLEALSERGSPIALTVDLDDADDAVLGLVRRVATTVRLPRLAQSREHLPTIVRAMQAELPEPDCAARFTPAVWERLMSWHWPGNLTELRNTVVLLARRSRGGIVEMDDLPYELRSSRQTVGLLQSAEREAVAEALRAAGGNRSRAAQALGIGRNTLYRKIREFGIS